MSSPGYEPLSVRIASSDPADKAAQAAYVQRLRSLQESLERTHSPDLAAQLDTALELGSYLVRSETLGPQQLVLVIAELVSRVEQSFDERLGDPWENAALDKDPEAHAPALPTPLSLRMRNEKLFGEILLQLGFVNDEQLSKGLQLQRATGERIGETLVALGALTWEQVGRACEIQDRLKHACVARR